ncbi:MAG: hypothetical protein HY238_28720, partial [Acidobacteria bacterium]|nr:hypothetical protein [Acidobacteriota bacterium]
MSRFILLAVLLCGAAPAGAAVGVRILLGVGDTAATNWDGGVTARGARIVSVEPWRFDGDDTLLPGNRWKMSTHQVRLFGGAIIPPNRPLVANGVIVQLEGESDDSELDVRTAQGDFSVRLA